MHDSGALIENISTEVVLVPLTRPVGTSIHQIESVGCVLVTVRTADGVTGEGFCFTIDGARIRAFDEMVNGLAQFAIGRSVFEAGRIWADVWGAINPTGHKGSPSLVLPRSTPQFGMQRQRPSACRSITCGARSPIASTPMRRPASG